MIQLGFVQGVAGLGKILVPVDLHLHGWGRVLLQKFLRPGVGLGELLMLDVVVGVNVRGALDDAPDGLGRRVVVGADRGIGGRGFARGFGAAGAAAAAGDGVFPRRDFFHVHAQDQLRAQVIVVQGAG